MSDFGWIEQNVLPRFLEPGEAVGPMGAAGLGIWKLLVDYNKGTGQAPQFDRVVVLTSARILLLRFSGGGGLLDALLGRARTETMEVDAIRWTSVREACVPPPLFQRQHLNLVVPQQGGAGDMVLSMSFFDRANPADVARQSDFCARAAMVAQERVATSRAAGMLTQTSLERVGSFAREIPASAPAGPAGTGTKVAAVALGLVAALLLLRAAISVVGALPLLTSSATAGVFAQVMLPSLCCESIVALGLGVTSALLVRRWRQG
jgi:hypothetical protein